jgi:molybdopterin/thiamine biosynthesis adenylyltransferase
MNTLTYPRHLLVAHLRDLMRGSDRPGLPLLRVPLGRSWSGATGLDFIVARSPAPCDLFLGVRLVTSWSPPRDADFADCDVLLSVGSGDRLRGQARGWFREPTGGPWTPLDHLLLGGAVDFLQLREVAADSTHVTGGESDDYPIPAEEFARRSRTIGAMGQEAFGRLLRLRVGFVGVGRLGGDLLFRLAETSGLRHAVLVDPDRVELHNTGESLFFDEGAVGQMKVHALENWLALHEPQVEVAAISSSVMQAKAIEALKRCDVLISAADHPAARLAAGAIAAAYGRVLLDVGTLVSSDRDSLAADVRLILPERCLLCYGGVSDEVNARSVIASPDLESAPRQWRQERAGSLDSLNDLAACAARRLLERWVAGISSTSVWLQFDESSEVPMRLHEPRPPLERECFCNLAGWADGGIPRVLDVLAKRAAAPW